VSAVENSPGLKEEVGQEADWQARLPTPHRLLARSLFVWGGQSCLPVGFLAVLDFPSSDTRRIIASK
jgi:hypothetical protein